VTMFLRMFDFEDAGIAIPRSVSSYLLNEIASHSRGPGCKTRALSFRMSADTSYRNKK